MIDADGGYGQLAGGDVAQVERLWWCSLPARAGEIVELASVLNPPDVDRWARRDEFPDDGGLIVTQQLKRARERRDDLLHALFMREACFKPQRRQVEPL